MKLLAILTFIVATTLTACSSSDGGSEGGGSENGVHNVDTAKGASLAADPAYRIIDVRTADEFGAGHLAQAENFDVQSADFESLIGALPKDGKYLVYCRSGNRSTQATAKMAALGFTDLTNVAGGGFTELAAAGAPVA